MMKITDETVLLPIVRDALAANPKVLADVRRGKLTAKKQLMGHVMRATSGGADPLLTERLIDTVVEEALSKTE